MAEKYLYEKQTDSVGRTHWPNGASIRGWRG